MTPAPSRLWLPPLQRFGNQAPPRVWQRRAQALASGPQGYLATMAQDFGLPDGSLPVGALLREYYAGDAGCADWLALDPAWIQVELNGARLLACGQLGLDIEQARALADAVRPAVEEAGFELYVSMPDRWQLRLPPETALPPFTAPERALGEDLFQHLPQGIEGRRWRLLINDIQVLLHQHPLNARRRQQGLPPVNSLWPWGGGALPAELSTDLTGVISDDPLLRALAARAEISHVARAPAAVAVAEDGWLVDLQDLPVDVLLADFIEPIRGLMRRRTVRLDFASGERFVHRPWHRWRFWRKAS